MTGARRTGCSTRCARSPASGSPPTPPRRRCAPGMPDGRWSSLSTSARRVPLRRGGGRAAVRRAPRRRPERTRLAVLRGPVGGPPAARSGLRRARLPARADRPRQMADAALSAAGRDPDSADRPPTAPAHCGFAAPVVAAGCWDSRPRRACSAATLRVPSAGAGARWRSSSASVTRLLAREVLEVLANVVMFGGDLVPGRRVRRPPAELAEAAGDDTTLVMALTDLVIVAAYAGDRRTRPLARHACVAVGPRAQRMGSPRRLTGRAPTRRGSGGPKPACRVPRSSSSAPSRWQSEVDAAFLAGVAPHASPPPDDPAPAPARFSRCSTSHLHTAARSGDPRRRRPCSGRYSTSGTAWVPGPSSGSRCGRWPRRCRARPPPRRRLAAGGAAGEPRASTEYGADLGAPGAVEDAARVALGARVRRRARGGRCAGRLREPWRSPGTSHGRTTRP